MDCYQITFESMNVINCYQITFESVDLLEELARNVVVQMNKALACIHSYFHWNTITITATTTAITITYIHSYFHSITTELIFGATAATGGRVKMLSTA